MTHRLLNPYRFGSNEQPVVSGTYGQPGAPNPQIANTGLTNVFTTSSTQSQTSSQGQLVKNGLNSTTNGRIIEGSVLTHTDATQLLWGYRPGMFKTHATPMTIQVGLYDVTAGFTGNPPLVAGTELTISIPANYELKFFPLPAPVALTVGRKYAIARSSGTWAGSLTFLVASYLSSASLPTGVGYEKTNTHPLPATWPISSSGQAIEGPYFIKGVMAPAMGDIPVTLNHRSRAEGYTNNTVAPTINNTVTLSQALSGNRGVAILYSGRGNYNGVAISSITLGGIEGLIYAAPPYGTTTGTASHSAVAFFPGSSNLAAGPHPLVVSFANGMSPVFNGYGYDADVYEFSDISQQSENHHYAHADGADDQVEVHAYTATTRPHDGICIACRGFGTTTPPRIEVANVKGVLGGHLEFQIGGTVNTTPLAEMSIVPVTANPTNIIFKVASSSRHQAVMFFPSRINA